MIQGLVHAVKSRIPNAITLMNLLMGCVGVSLAAWGDLVGASRAVMLSAFLDLFDGMAARALGVASPVGKDLDSLADVVSFGLVPSFILYQLAASAPGLAGTEWIVYVHTLAAALRLARFNHDTRQTDHFIGLASPAAALILVSAVAFLGQNEPLSLQIRSELTKLLIYGAGSGTALLMLAPLPMPSLKNRAPGPAIADLVVLGTSALVGVLSAWLLSPDAGIFCALLTYTLCSVLRLLLFPNSFRP
ncbi:MAG: CDP-alcohol phosphatidyltransferase family protein [Bacteroidota bacterium]